MGPEVVHKDESYQIIGICMEVHRILGSGLLEIVYKDALEYEFAQQKIPFAREKAYEIEYKGIILPHQFNADFVVGPNIILEVKAIKFITDAHLAQTLNYVKLAKSKLGLIVNFGTDSLESRRVLF
jgi:GxxExxY protein